MKALKFYGDQLVTGKNAINYMKTLNYERIFIVTGGSSAFKNGSIKEIENIFSNKKIKIFSGIKKNPDTTIVDKGVIEMKDFEPDLVLGIGGGSPIDAAKVMTLFYDYESLNFKNVLKKDISNYKRKTDFIAIPSTSGTGTEVTKAAVITFNDLDLKIGLKSIGFIPDMAILDSRLTLSMPKNIVAETGLDALTHALECYINHNLDDFTEAMAKGAIEGLLKHLRESYHTGNIESREKVHNYQALAGMAFQNVGLGMAHGISHAFGGMFDFGHGLLNGICLPYVLEYNSKDPRVQEKIDYLSRVLDVDNVIDEIKALNKELSIPKSFKALGLAEDVFRENLDLLIDNSLKGSTRGNPVEMNREEMKKILVKIYNGNEKSRE
ncbi:MAG TPA: iron-containing alcohol dehydrogenase [Clostridia bacterium]|nr:iron-containing alcohol dehydrogenase [Clostridia bacterium]